MRWSIPSLCLSVIPLPPSAEPNEGLTFFSIFSSFSHFQLSNFHFNFQTDEHTHLIYIYILVQVSYLNRIKKIEFTYIIKGFK